MIDFVSWMKGIEWYDNHKLSVILACLRKAYWHYEFRAPSATPEEPTGLASTVGPGADFGSCIHSGFGAYYGLWGKASEEERRQASFMSFNKKYAHLFRGREDYISSKEGRKHTLENGLDILDCYYDQFLIEDHKWRPVEVELAAIYPFIPRPDEPDFPPFWYVMRADGVWEYVATGEWYVQETKTTSGGVARELKRLHVNRQTTGYAAVLSEFPDGRRIRGVVPNVVLIAIGKRDAGRDMIAKYPYDYRSWRRQTINIVQRWRAIRAEANGKGVVDVLDIYTQNDGECTKYGLCPFYDACDFGAGAMDAVVYKFTPNVWNPLNSLAGEDA
jgi:hypothetical protein